MTEIPDNLGSIKKMNPKQALFKYRLIGAILWGVSIPAILIFFIMQNEIKLDSVLIGILAVTLITVLAFFGLPHKLAVIWLKLMVAACLVPFFFGVIFMNFVFKCGLAIIVYTLILAYLLIQSLILAASVNRQNE